MANATADQPLRFIGEVKTEKFHHDNSAARTIYKGEPLLINMSLDTLYAAAWHDGTGEGVVAATDVFLGIAAEGKTVATTDAETSHSNLIEAYVQPTIVGFKSTVFTNANLGAAVYMSDTGTLSTTAADNPVLGKLHRVEDGYAFVRLVSPAICTGA